MPPAERLKQRDVLWSRQQPLLTAQHMTDPHQMVVNHMRKVVRRKSVGLEYDEVALVPAGIATVHAHGHVCESDVPVGEFEANDALAALAQVLLDC